MVKIIGMYKFALVLEDSDYAEYVTEKIFQVFAAGTVPIYKGPRDIFNYLPCEKCEFFGLLNDCMRYY
jgi:hypothetical protein